MRAGHVEVFLEAFDLCIADVAAVEEGEEVEKGEHGDEAEVHFAEGFGGVDGGGGGGRGDVVGGRGGWRGEVGSDWLFGRHGCEVVGWLLSGVRARKC